MQLVFTEKLAGRHQRLLITEAGAKALRELNHDAAEKSANGKKKVKVSKPVEVTAEVIALSKKNDLPCVRVAARAGQPQIS